MGRSRFGSEGADAFVGFIVLGFIVAVLAYSCSKDERDSEPSQRPAATTQGPSSAESPGSEEKQADDGGVDTGEVGIQFGYACSPVAALGTAEDGRPAKCFMGKDGRARWGFDSKRG